MTVCGPHFVMGPWLHNAFTDSMAVRGAEIGATGRPARMIEKPAVLISPDAKRTSRAQSPGDRQLGRCFPDGDFVPLVPRAETICAIRTSGRGCRRRSG